MIKSVFTVLLISGFSLASTFKSTPTHLSVQAVSSGSNPQLSGINSNHAKDLGLYSCTTMAGDQPCYGITDYSRFLYDPNTRKILFFGGGHATTFRDDVDQFDLTNLTWAPAYSPTPCEQMTEQNFDASNGIWKSTGHPFSRHTYDMMVIADQELVLLSQAGGRGGCAPGVAGDFFSSNRIHHYNPKTKVWSFGGTIGSWFYAAASEYDPISKKIVVVGPNNQAGAPSLWIYDPITKITSATQVNVPNIGGSSVLVFYPPNQKFYLFDGGSVFEVSLDRSNFSKSTVTLVQSSGVGSAVPAYAYNPQSGLIGGGVKDGVFYSFNPTQKSWQSKQIVTSSTHAIGTISFHNLDFDPINGVYIFLSRPSGEALRTWAYKP